MSARQVAGSVASVAWWRAVVGLVALLAALSAVRSARAQVDVELRLSAREVGIGEVLQVKLDAMGSEDGTPSSPELVVPDSFEVRGPSVGTRQQVSITNFNMVTQRGISATWLLTPTRPGVYTIGPATVTAGGKTYQAQATQVRVLAKGQTPARRRRRSPLDPFDSFDPFGRDDPFDDIFERLRRGSASRLPEAPPELVVENPRNRLAFLRAELSKTSAIVGEQVTLSIYAYGSQGPFQEAAGSREPSHPDFLARRLIGDDPTEQPQYQFEVDGETWVVVKVREIALFPLRVGRLEIGPLEFGFLGRRYGARSGQGLRRESRSLFVDVSPPPAAGRPAGFAGEVGRFELVAHVQPREVVAGGSISVQAVVRGEGRLPSELKLPEQAGVEWVEPTLSDDVTVTGSKVGGSRTYSYVVRLLSPGDVDLGSLRLPYYDPEAGRYREARADLGDVRVTPGKQSAPQSDAPSGPRLSDLFAFRSEPRPVDPPRYLSDSVWFWVLLPLGPVGMALAMLARLAYRRAQSSRERRGRSRATHASRALEEARAAQRRAAPKDVASATERALYEAVEWATGLKARAVVRPELPRALCEAGLSEELSGRVVTLFDACGALRFGSGSGGSSEALLRDAERVVKGLVRQAPAARGAES